MQNNRHLLEVFFPDACEEPADGWKLSMRLRFVHARGEAPAGELRRMGPRSIWYPVARSAPGFVHDRLFHASVAARRVGGRYFRRGRAGERHEGLRYTGHVVGVPESILFADRNDAGEIFKAAHMCEPPPDQDSATMANALIGAIPFTAGISGPEEQRAVTQLPYTLSRALIGNELADQLQFPKTRTFGALFAYRMKQRFRRLVKSKQLLRSENFCQLLEISVYDESQTTGMSYRIPDHVNATKSSPW